MLASKGFDRICIEQLYWLDAYFIWDKSIFFCKSTFAKMRMYPLIYKQLAKKLNIGNSRYVHRVTLVLNLLCLPRIEKINYVLCRLH